MESVKNYVEILVNTVAKTLVEAFENLTIEDVNMYKIGYFKAIDDFVKLTNEISGWTPNCREHYLSLTVFTIHQIAEELKKENQTLER